MALTGSNIEMLDCLQGHIDAFHLESIQRG
jgi:hypothetical protein